MKRTYEKALVFAVQRSTNMWLCASVSFVVSKNSYATCRQSRRLRLFSQSISLTQYVVLCACLSVCLFQLASKSSQVVVARRRSDYCPRGAIFWYVLCFYDKIVWF